VIDAQNNLFIKDRSDTAWLPCGGPFRTVAIDGNRIGALDMANTLFLNDGTTGAAWVRQADGVLVFGLAS
jgi:hypothetical protein